jgi:hypothetical protein
MRSVKLVARGWVKNPLDVLWMVTRLNRMNVTVRDLGRYLQADCQDEDYLRFRQLAHRFCLVCDNLTAC